MGFEKDYLKKIIFGLEKNNKALYSRENDELAVNRTYLGGKNNIGRYFKNKDLRLERKIAIDIDITSAYPRAFGCISLPDWESWKRTISAEEYLEDISNFCNQEKTYTKLGFFNTKFSFPEETFEPWLPQKTEWGLIYTFEGQTRATFPEILEATRNCAIRNGDITELILYRERLINGNFFFPFADYLREIEEERAKWKKDSFEYQLYKISENGLYGKIGQGIEVRKFLTLEGENEKLRLSRITCAEYASHVTGIIRATLTSLINEIEKYPECEVVHWTTDGLTFIMSLDCEGSVWRDKEYPELKTDEKGEILECLSLKDINPKLWQKIDSLSLTKLIKEGGERIGIKREWLEVKTFGDKISSETTRGNWVSWKGITQSISRAGISSKIIKNSEDFEKYVKKEEITEAAIRNLTNIQEIIKNGWDLVRKRTIKKREGLKTYFLQTFREINIGADGKRKLLDDGVKYKAFQKHRRS